MGLYKIIFSNNKATSVYLLKQQSVQAIAEFKSNTTGTTILWYVINADSESEAIDVAEKVVKKIWGKVLGIE